MPFFPLERPSRAPRVSFVENTPAVVRSSDGCHKGKLQTVSVTGGLLYLPKPVDQGLKVKLMFLTRSGAVLGAAEMLSPISWSLQPFKFLKLYDDDQRRLEATIQSSLKQTWRDRVEMERFRAW
jgi:hypothetical protein